MHNPPLNFEKYTEQLANAIRHSDEVVLDNDSNIERYQTFLRDNIASVISYSFPSFDSYIDLDEKASLVKEFLANHGAEEPEFHHIATEFVRFIQQRGDSYKSKMCLLEYEWVLLCTEIHPANVIYTNIKQSSKSLNLLTEKNIVLNPTLQCIELPFLINTEGKVDLKSESSTVFFYGIFRTSEHQVLCKPLSVIDRLIIGLIDQFESISYSNLAESMPQRIDSFNLGEWLIDFSNINLINIVPEGEKI